MHDSYVTYLSCDVSNVGSDISKEKPLNEKVCPNFILAEMTIQALEDTSCSLKKSSKYNSNPKNSSH